MTNSNQTNSDSNTQLQGGVAGVELEPYTTPRLVSYGKFQHITLQVSDRGGTEGDTGPDPGAAFLAL